MATYSPQDEINQQNKQKQWDMMLQAAALNAANKADWQTMLGYKLGNWLGDYIRRGLDKKSTTEISDVGKAAGEEQGQKMLNNAISSATNSEFAQGLANANAKANDTTSKGLLAGLPTVYSDDYTTAALDKIVGSQYAPVDVSDSSTVSDALTRIFGTDYKG